MAFLISYLASRTWITLRRQSGQALVEYGIIIAMIAIVCVIILITQGATVSDVFSNVVCGFGHCPAPVEPTPTPTPLPCEGGDYCRHHD